MKREEQWNDVVSVAAAVKANKLLCSEPIFKLTVSYLGIVNHINRPEFINAWITVEKSI